MRKVDKKKRNLFLNRSIIFFSVILLILIISLLFVLIKSEILFKKSILFSPGEIFVSPDPTTVLNLDDVADLTIWSQGQSAIFFVNNINFLENNPLTTSQDVLDRIGQNVQLDYNSIVINSQNMPELNKEALIGFYDNNELQGSLTLLKDGEECPESECQFVEYLDGIWYYHIIGFSNYTLIGSSINITNYNSSSIKSLFDSGYKIINTEGQNAMVGDLIVVNDQDEGKMLQVISIGNGTSSNDYTRLRDIITMTDYDFSTGLNNKTTAPRSIGGASYDLFADPSNNNSNLWTVNLTWGAGSTTGDVGSQTTIFPRIRTDVYSPKWVAILTSNSISNKTFYQLPSNRSLSVYKTGYNLTDNITNQMVDDLTYSIIWSTTNGNLTNITVNGTTCSFDDDNPVLLFIDNDTGNYCQPLMNMTSSNTNNTNITNNTSCTYNVTNCTTYYYNITINITNITINCTNITFNFTNETGTYTIVTNITNCTHYFYNITENITTSETNCTTYYYNYTNCTSNDTNFTFNDTINDTNFTMNNTNFTMNNTNSTNNQSNTTINSPGPPGAIGGGTGRVGISDDDNPPVDERRVTIISRVNTFNQRINPDTPYIRNSRGSTTTNQNPPEISNNQPDTSSNSQNQIESPKPSSVSIEKPSIFNKYKNMIYIISSLIVVVGIILFFIIKAKNKIGNNKQSNPDNSNNEYQESILTGSKDE